MVGEAAKQAPTKKGPASVGPPRFDCWPRESRLAGALPWAAMAFAIVLLAGWPKSNPLFADSVAYRAMAMGQFDRVPASIAGRALHPLSVRALARLFHLNIDQSFFLIDILALAVLLAAVAWMLKAGTGGGFLVLPIAFTPVLVNFMFGIYYCQDLFYAALLAVFFVLLARHQLWAALTILVPLYLTRESTLLLATVLAGVAYVRSKSAVVVACAMVSIASLAAGRLFAAQGGLPNVHHVNELVFLALKIPFDSLRNLPGVVLVPNEMAGTAGFTCTPLTTVRLPPLLRFGAMREFGVCAWDFAGPLGPLHTFSLSLTLFGIGPGVLGFLLVRHWRGLAREPLWLTTALIYGVAAFLAAPMVSFLLERDMGYGWPAFWLAAPALFVRYCPRRARLIAALVIENFLVCWLPQITASHSSYEAGWSGFVVVCALAMQAIAIATLKVFSAESITGGTSAIMTGNVSLLANEAPD